MDLAVSDCNQTAIAYEYVAQQQNAADLHCSEMLTEVALFHRLRLSLNEVSKSV
jgi:hypothetical protein